MTQFQNGDRVLIKEQVHGTNRVVHYLRPGEGVVVNAHPSPAGNIEVAGVSRNSGNPLKNFVHPHDLELIPPYPQPLPETRVKGLTLSGDPAELVIEEQALDPTHDLKLDRTLSGVYLNARYVNFLDRDGAEQLRDILVKRYGPGPGSDEPVNDGPVESFTIGCDVEPQTDFASVSVADGEVYIQVFEDNAGPDGEAHATIQLTTQNAQAFAEEILGLVDDLREGVIFDAEVK